MCCSWKNNQSNERSMQHDMYNIKIIISDFASAFPEIPEQDQNLQAFPRISTTNIYSSLLLRCSSKNRDFLGYTLSLLTLHCGTL